MNKMGCSQNGATSGWYKPAASNTCSSNLQRQLILGDQLLMLLDSMSWHAESDCQGGMHAYSCHKKPLPTALV